MRLDQATQTVLDTCARLARGMVFALPSGTKMQFRRIVGEPKTWTIRRTVPRFLLEVELWDSLGSEAITQEVVTLLDAGFIVSGNGPLPGFLTQCAIKRGNFAYASADGRRWDLWTDGTDCLKASWVGETNLKKAWNAIHHEGYQLTPKGMEHTAMGRAELYEVTAGEAKAPKKPRGPSVHTDPAVDSKLHDAWKNSGARTYADGVNLLHSAFPDLTEKKLRAAVDRHRKR